jgi:hypothetical protein
MINTTETCITTLSFWQPRTARAGCVRDRFPWCTIQHGLPRPTFCMRSMMLQTLGCQNVVYIVVSYVRDGEEGEVRRSGIGFFGQLFRAFHGLPPIDPIKNSDTEIQEEQPEE